MFFRHVVEALQIVGSAGVRLSHELPRLLAVQSFCGCDALRPTVDHRLVDVEEAEPLGDEVPDVRAACARRVRDAHHVASHPPTLRARATRVKAGDDTLPPLGEVSEWSKERDWKSRTCCKV